MIQNLMGLVAILAFAYLYLEERKDRAKAELAWRQERAQLLNRIKPETAQAAPGEPEYPSPRGVVPDDDASFWAARGIDVSEVR